MPSRPGAGDTSGTVCVAWSNTVSGWIWNHPPGFQPPALVQKGLHTALSNPITNRSMLSGEREIAATCCVVWSNTVSEWIWNHLPGFQPPALVQKVLHTALSNPITNSSMLSDERDTPCTCCVVWSNTVSEWIWNQECQLPSGNGLSLVSPEGVPKGKRICTSSAKGSNAS